MATRPDPAVLYPDIAARGSLGAALRAVAEEAGFSLPPTACDSGSLTGAAVRSTLPHRRPLQITGRSFERQWSVWGADMYQDVALVKGETDDLTQVARAAVAWHEGDARMVASEWQLMLTEAGEPDQPWHADAALVEAAHAEPTLRALYPYTSH